MSIKKQTPVYFGAGMIDFVASFALLPVTTRILGPFDYGLFALVVTITLVGPTLGVVGTPLIVATYLPADSREDRRELLSTLVTYCLAVTLGYSVLVIAGLPLLTRFSPGLSSLSPVGYVLALGAMLLTPFWLIAYEVVSVEGKAVAYASVVVTQVILRSAAVLLALYIFDVGVVALFAGAFATALVQAIGALFILGFDLRPRLSRRWLVEIKKLIPRTLLNNGLSTANQVTERTLLSAHVGLGQLGLYSHSQSYRSVASLATRSINRASWPVSLAEARDSANSFDVTGRVWTGGHVMLTFPGLAAAALGDFVISALTNGRFTESYALVVFWMILVLFESMGRGPVAIFFGLGAGKDYLALVGISFAASLASLPLLIPMFGMGGAVGGIFIQTIVLRVLVGLRARRYRSFRFQDQWAIAGVVMIAMTFTAKVTLDPDLRGSIILFLISCGVWLAIGFHPILQLWRSLMRSRDAAAGEEAGQDRLEREAETKDDVAT